MIRHLARRHVRYLIIGGFLYAAIVLLTVFGLAVLGGTRG